MLMHWHGEWISECERENLLENLYGCVILKPACSIIIA